MITVALLIGCEAPPLPGGASTQAAIQLTPAAAEMVREVLRSDEGSTHLIMSVEFDDEKFCTGAGYNLRVGKSPATAEFDVFVVNGVNVAVERADSAFLSGTTLDFGSLPTGERGFIFRNPNDPESVPKALRAE